MNNQNDNNLKIQKPCLSGACVMVIGFLMSTSAFGAKLADTEGLSSLQSATGAAVQTVCGGLAKLGNTITDTPHNAEQDLFNQCNAMVQNGNELQGDQTNGNSLGLNNSELGGALQNVATEEMATPSRIATSTLSGHIAAVSSHLFEIHKLQGGAGGDDDEEGSLLDNRLSLFVNGIGGFGDINTSDLEDGSDFNTGGIVLGADYRINNNWVTGLAGGYTRLNSDFRTNINVSGGSVNADIGHLSLFSTYDIENFYVDGIFSYGWSGYEIDRSVFVMSNNAGSTGGANRMASADTDGQQYSTAMSFGYNFHHDALNLRPFARVSYFHGQIDSYNEQGAFGLDLNVDEQRFESLQSIVGGQISYAFSQSFGVLIPQANVSWIHEFLDDSRVVTASYSADPNGNILRAATNGPDRDYASLGAGLSGVFQGGTQVFLNYQTILGYERVTSHGFSAGVRLDF